MTSIRTNPEPVAVCPHCGQRCVSSVEHLPRFRRVFTCVTGRHGVVHAASQYAAGVGGAR